MPDFPLGYGTTPKPPWMARGYKPLALVGGPPAEVVIFEDDATGAAATIAGRTPDTVQVGSNTWNLYATANTIETDGSGNFGVSGASGIKYAYIDIGVDTATITCPIYLENWTGILIRYGDQNNHFEVSLNNTNGLYIRERTSGSAATRALTATTFANLTEHLLTVALTSSSIEASVGAVTASYSSTSKNGNTFIGLVPLATSSQHKWRYLKAVE